MFVADDCGSVNVQVVRPVGDAQDRVAEVAQKLRDGGASRFCTKASQEYRDVTLCRSEPAEVRWCRSGCEPASSAGMLSGQTTRGSVGPAAESGRTGETYPEITEPHP